MQGEGGESQPQGGATSGLPILSGSEGPFWKGGATLLERGSEDHGGRAPCLGKG